MAETFTFKDVHGTSLGDVAQLDTLITVVDGSSFMEELHVMDTLKDRGWETGEEDSRTIADLFCDQIEFANVIVMNKTDLMNDADRRDLWLHYRGLTQTHILLKLLMVKSSHLLF